MCVIEEAKQDGLKFEISERIKEKVEAPRLLINRKYGGHSMEPIFANVIIFSNHWDAFAMDDDNRRIYVIAGPEQIPSGEYFARLYGALQHPAFVGSIYRYLINLDISGVDFFQPRRDNAARKRLIMSTQSETEQAFWAAFNDPANAVCQYAEFEESARQHLEDSGGEGFALNEKQLKALFKKYAGEKRSVRVNESGNSRSKWVYVMDKTREDWREIARVKYGE